MASVPPTNTPLTLKCSLHPHRPVSFSLHTTMPLSKLMDAFCNKFLTSKGMPPDAGFFFSGVRIFSDDTPQSLGMTDGSSIDAVPRPQLAEVELLCSELHARSLGAPLEPLSDEALRPLSTLLPKWTFADLRTLVADAGRCCTRLLEHRAAERSKLEASLALADAQETVSKVKAGTASKATAGPSPKDAAPVAPPTEVTVIVAYADCSGSRPSSAKSAATANTTHFEYTFSAEARPMRDLHKALRARDLSTHVEFIVAVDAGTQVGGEEGDGTQ